MSRPHRNDADALRRVLTFTFLHWRRQPWRIAVIAGAITLSTLADIVVPFFVGRLVDALTAPAADRLIALHRAIDAFAIIACLGPLSITFRHIAWTVVIPFTLRIMGDVAEASIHHVQRLSTDWHANAFAGSVVRKITRGMGSLDQLNDVLLLALLSSSVVLLGTIVLFTVQWPVLGVVVAIGAAFFVAISILSVTRYVGPAARASSRWDTRLGGALADTLGCNAVVKAFGAEAREDARIAWIVAKWRRRVGRTWSRHSQSNTGQLAVLFAMRTSVVAVAIFLWWERTGDAGRGDLRPDDLFRRQRLPARYRHGISARCNAR